MGVWKEGWGRRRGKGEVGKVEWGRWSGEGGVVKVDWGMASEL